MCSRRSAALISESGPGGGCAFFTSPKSPSVQLPGDAGRGVADLLFLGHIEHQGREIRAELAGQSFRVGGLAGRCPSGEPLLQEFRHGGVADAGGNPGDEHMFHDDQFHSLQAG